MLETPYRRSHAQSSHRYYGPTRRLRACSFSTSVTLVEEQRCEYLLLNLWRGIVNDILLLSSVTTLSHLRGDMKTLRDYVDLWGYQVCAHFTLREEPPLFYLYSASPTSQGQNCAQLLHTLRIIIQILHFMSNRLLHGHFLVWLKEGLHHKVSAFRRLGDCRSLFDWSWRSMATLETADNPRTKHPLEYGPGMVRDRWNIYSMTQSEWIEVPGMAFYTSRTPSK
jgi:hypothetical protein